MVTFINYLLTFCFIAGLVIHLSAFLGLLWETRCDRPRPVIHKKLMAIGNRGIQLIQVSLLLSVVWICIVGSQLNPGRYIAILVIGYGIAFAVWVPFKLLLFMASGGSQRMIDKLFGSAVPPSPA